MSAQSERARRLYRDTFGTDPAVVARAPGRLEVLGNHTDYNEGFVLSCAIDRDIHVAVGRAPDAATFEFISSQYPQRAAVSDVSPRKEQGWVNYPLGVCAMIRERGDVCPAFRIAVHGEVPLGAGLSSSAALEVSTAIALRRLYGLGIADDDVARLCQAAENRFAGAQCGLLDQFSSLFGEAGHLLYTDFRSFTHRVVRLPAPEPCVVLTLSGVTHTLAESGYNERRESCLSAAGFFAGKDPAVRSLRDVTMAQLLDAKEALDPLLFRRARHVIGENERVQQALRLLEQGDMAAFGRLLYESHQSSRDNFENSCTQLDTLVDIAASVEGVYGARLTGGGWGGATLAVLRPAAAGDYQTAACRYKTPAGTPPEAYEIRFADGAGLVMD